MIVEVTTEAELIAARNNASCTEIRVTAPITLTAAWDAYVTLGKALYIQKGCPITTGDHIFQENGPHLSLGLYPQYVAASGKVLYGSGATDHVCPEWWDGIDVHAAAESLKLAATGGGVVRLTARIYTVSNHMFIYAGFVSTAGIHLWPGVVLEGNSTTGSRISLANGQNCDVVRSWNFAGMTGANKWYTNSGSWDEMPTAFGLRNASVDGNKQNNTSGRGIAFCGKSYILSNVVVHDCAQDGYYSEAGRYTGTWDPTGDTHSGSTDDDANSGGDFGAWRAEIYGDVSIASCYNGGNGVTFKGPHDFVIERISSHHNNGFGLYTDRKADAATGYAGKVIIGSIHTWGNGNGVQASLSSGNHIGTHFTCESAIFEDALEITPQADDASGATVNYVQIANLTVNVPGGTAFSGGKGLNISTKYVQIGNLTIKARDNHTFPTLAYIAGEGCQIGNLLILGTETTAYGTAGLWVNADYVTIAGGMIRDVKNTPTATGKGLRLANRKGCDINVDLVNCNTGFYYPTAGSGNRIRSWIEACDTPKNGTAGTTDVFEIRP